MMKSFFKKLAFVMALAMVVSLAAPAATTAAAAEKLEIAYQNGSAITELNIAKVDGTEDLRFLGAKTMKSVVWESDNTAVATVDEKGIVTAKADGTANITVTVDGLSATVKVYCVTLSENKATIGSQDGTQRSMSTHTMKVDETFDFRFFGIKDYDAKRYECTWKSLVPEVADVDKNGVVTAYKPGTAALTLVVLNTITGKAYVVDSCVITVEAEEPVATATPVPEAEIVAKQESEDSLYITFNNFKGLDLEKLVENKANIEIYARHDAGEADEQLYVWQIHWMDVVDNMENTIFVQGYGTDELVDGQEYVVKYVVPNDEEEDVVEIAKDTFTASVGAVTDMDLVVKTYWNNQGAYSFEGFAYTTAGLGEDIDTEVEYTLYDANKIDVTDHYARIMDEDLITFELLDEDADSYYDFDEETNIFQFNDIPEDPTVDFEVTFEDYDGNEPVVEKLTITVKEAKPYEVVDIHEWFITLVDAAHIGDKVKNKDIALYDDQNLYTGAPLENHAIVLYIEDNYGNFYVTHEKFDGDKIDDKKYYYIETSPKFSNEGFELQFEAKNPQVLVVGDEFEDATTNSNIITTKKTGTGTVNVVLYNTYEDEIVNRIDTIKIPVKAQRVVKKVDATGVTLTTDSIPVGATTTRVEDPNNEGNEGDYDTRFTTETVVIKVYDQYDKLWGIYNTSAEQSISVDVEATNVEVDALSFGDSFGERWDVNDDGDEIAFEGYYAKTLDGVEVLEALGGYEKKEASVAYKVTVWDEVNEEEKTDTFRVYLKYPTFVEDEDADDYTDIITKDRLELTVDNAVDYTDLKTTIAIYEYSKNGLKVNYADDIVILDDNNYVDYFGNRTTDPTEKVSEGALFLVVTDPKGNRVDVTTVNTTNANTTDTEIGIYKHESGLYTFWFAETNSADSCTKFATAGSYTVKLLEVTGVDEDGYITNTTAQQQQKIRLSDNRMTIAVTGQDVIYMNSDSVNYYEDKYTQDDTISAIATVAFGYNKDLDHKPVNTQVTGVRFQKNVKADQVVVRDVFFKVFLNANFNDKYTDDTAYYFVEVPVDMTISLEDIDDISGDNSVANGKDPNGDKMQR